MYSLPDGQFTVAVLIGALAIWFHAWNRFNQPSYRESSVSRIMRRLQPVDMRKGSIFIRAYVFYALILTAIYLLICFYAFLLPTLPEVFRADIPGLGLLQPVGAETLPEQATTGASFDTNGGALAPVDARAAGGPSASLPLLVALAVVGLVPNVPALYRIEEWIRAKAHSLSGIPTHLIDSGLKLRSEPWLKTDRTSGLLISPEDWQLIQDVYRVAERDGLSDRSVLRQHVLKIVALRNWVIRDGVFVPDPHTRFNYHGLESEVQQQIRGLLGHLDTFRAVPPPTAPAEAAERKQEWAAIVAEALTLCADISVLVALYSERDAFAAEIKEAQAHPRHPTDSVEAERHEAVEIFVRALERVSLIADRDSFGTTVFFRLAGCIVLAATLLGLVVGGGRVANFSGQVVLAFQFAVSAAITYTLPLFFALIYQQEGLKRGSWENVFGRKKARVVAQYVGMFLIASLIALVGLVANNVIFAIAGVGLAKVTDNLLEVLQFAVSLETHRAILGGVLALCLALIIDAWRTGKLGGWRSAWTWMLVLLPTVGLGGIAWWERATASAIGRMMQGEDLVPFLSHWQAGAVPALIGLIAAVYVIQSLMDEFPVGEEVKP